MSLSIKEIRSNAAKKAHETRKKMADAAKNPKPVKKLAARQKIELPKDPKWAAPKEIMAKTVVFVLSLSSIGNRRQVDTEEFGIDEDSKKLFNTTKKLMNAKELAEIATLYGSLKRKVSNFALPSLIKDGVYLLPTAFVKDTEALLNDGVKELNEIVNRLCKPTRLKDIVDEAEERLSKVDVAGKKKNFFNPDEYLSAEEIREAYRISWRYMYVDSAENLNAISKELYEKERKKTEAAWAETGEAIQQILRAQMKGLVDHLVDRMTPDEFGRVKTFHSFDKFNDFLATLDARNLNNDTQLKTLANECRSLMSSTSDLQALRDDAVLRTHVKDGFEQVQELLNDMIQDAPKRRIILRD